MNNIIQPLRMYDITDGSDHSFQNKMSLSSYIQNPMLLADRNSLMTFTWQREKVIVGTTNPSQAQVYSQIAITSVLAIDESGNEVELVDYLTFEVRTISDLQRVEGSDTVIVEQITYWNNSTIPTLPRGIWYLLITDASPTPKTWISDKFVSKSAGNEVLFEYRHDQIFMNMAYTPGVYFNVRLTGVTYDTMEVDQVRETYSNAYKDEKDKFLKYYQLKGLQSLMDGNLKAVFDLMRHHSTVYITTETGERKLIRIMDVSADPVRSSNQGGVTIKYEEIDDRILSITDYSSTVIYTQTGVDFVDQSGLNIGGTALTIGGAALTIGS